jgi:hypothetical protein
MHVGGGVSFVLYFRIIVEVIGVVEVDESCVKGAKGVICRCKNKWVF